MYARFILRGRWHLRLNYALGQIGFRYATKPPARDIPAWTQPKSDGPHRAQNPRINRVRYWRPLSGLFLFLRRVSPDREGGIVAALPSFNNLIAVGPGDPVGNPLLQPRTKINNLTAVLAGSLI